MTSLEALKSNKELIISNSPLVKGFQVEIIKVSKNKREVEENNFFSIDVLSRDEYISRKKTPSFGYIYGIVDNKVYMLMEGIQGIKEEILLDKDHLSHFILIESGYDLERVMNVKLVLEE